jgi:hypothetical protein
MADLEVVGHVGDQVDVAAGREGVPGPADHDRPHLGIAVDLGPDAGQVAVHLVAGRVQASRGGHHHPQDPLGGPFQLQARVGGVAVGHRCSSGRSAGRRHGGSPAP